MSRNKIFFGWWILCSSALTTAFSGLVIYGLPAFYPTLVSHFGWSRTAIASGYFFTLSTNSLIQLLFGHAIDRHGARKVLILGTLVTGTAYLTFGFVNSLHSYYSVCFLLGIGWAAMAYLPNSALVSRWFVKKRGLAIGLVTACAALGGAAAPPLVTYLILHAGWRSAFGVIGAACMILPLLPLLTIVRETPQSMGLQPDGLGDLSSDVAPPLPEKSLLKFPKDQAENFFALMRRNRATWPLIIGLFLLGVVINSTFAHLILYLRGKGFAPYMAAAMASLQMTFGIAGRLGFGFIADKTSIRSASVTFLLFLATSSVLVFFVTVPGLVYVFAMCNGLGHGGITAFIPVVFSTLFPERHMGKNIAIGLTVYSMGLSSGPAFMGFIFDSTGSYFYAFVLNVFLVTMATFIILGYGIVRPKLVPATVETAPV